MSYFGIHNHTHYSNLRLLDCINTPESLINKAMELGLSGVAITDHECLSGHIDALKKAIEIQKVNPDFRIALGNEIYLTETRNPGQEYYHFILIAKDAIGYKQLCELSSTAWNYSFVDRGMERVPTLKNELEEIVSANPGHLIATTACIGGEMSNLVLALQEAEEVNDITSFYFVKAKIKAFVTYCKNLFGDDFYIECAPSAYGDQIMANQALRKYVADEFNIKMVFGTDAHYLTAADRSVHKAYLNSKDGEREVDDFYKYSYLMTDEEVVSLLGMSFDKEFIYSMMDNTKEIQNKITYYSLFHKQDIPKVEVKDYPKKVCEMVIVEETKEQITTMPYKHLSEMLMSDDIQNRYWVNECLNKLIELGKYNDIYLSELEEEARVKSVISEKLETNMFRYPNTLQHYIDMIWECGSIVGAGRGSSCAALNHYLMGITQLDPIQWDLPFFRYLNDERVELGSLILILPSYKKRV